MAPLGLTGGSPRFFRGSNSLREGLKVPIVAADLRSPAGYFRLLGVPSSRLRDTSWKHHQFRYLVSSPFVRVLIWRLGCGQCVWVAPPSMSWRGPRYLLQLVALAKVSPEASGDRLTS